MSLQKISEIRNEICLPPSGLAKVNYPDVFPSPPIGSPPSIEASMVGTGAYPSGSQRSILTPELVRRWGYYLSDIAVRRIANRLVNAFYQDSASSWLSMPIDRMIRVAKELELQLTQWLVFSPFSLSIRRYLTTRRYDNLPAVVTTSEPPSPSYRPEELRSLPHLRFLEFLERIYRPFLYLAIHLEASSPIHQIIEPYVERCLSACIDIASKGINRHRHHGTWYLNRTHLCDCVVLLAAVKSRRVNVPEGWRDAVNLSIVGLKFWEREAPDLRRGREILEIILGDIDESGI
jgi:hypothetical protein